MNTDYSELMTQTKAAAYAGVSPSALNMWKRLKRVLPDVHIGGRSYYSKSHMDRLKASLRPRGKGYDLVGYNG